ncbi:hypothetical protein J4409_03080 [Candidatus Woesearchaeota archaeon]|nr:hypothetical protein [Candidatus Woesearchaeota archaeon]
MTKRVLRTITKYASVALLSSVIAYKANDKIEYLVNTARFYNSVNEPGFLSKDQTFNLEIVNEKNNKNNLETYLKLNDIKYEVYSRDNGLILSDAFHNWGNFNDEEKKGLIYTELKNSSQEKLESMLNKDIFLDMIRKISPELRIQLVDSYLNTAEKDELRAILSNTDYEELWHSIPNEIKKEMLLKNLKSSTKKSMQELKGLLRNFWGGYGVY